MESRALSVDRIDETFRRLFREELPGRVDALEKQLATLLGAEAGNDEFNAFYRGVHNVKGNAATFGFHPLVSVCHRLEDLLKYTAPAARRSEPGFRSSCLALLDLMHDAVAEGDDALDRIQTRLAELKTDCERRPRRALLIGDSRSTMALCQQILEKHHYDVVLARDGYMALHRALTEPFEILITTGETRLLRGEALIAALRLSDTRNKHALAVVLTSGDASGRRHQRNTDPDLVIARDTRLTEELEAILAGIDQ